MTNHGQNKRRIAVFAPSVLLAALIFVMAAASGDIVAQTGGAAPPDLDDYMPLILKVEPIYGTKKVAPETEGDRPKVVQDRDKIVGFEINVSNIPQKSKGTPSVPFRILTCCIEIRHMETGKSLNTRTIRIPIRAPRNGLVDASVPHRQTSRRPLNSGTWLVEAKIKSVGGSFITIGDSAFNVTPARLPLELAQDRKQYEALLDKVEEYRKEVDAYAELHRKQGLVGAKVPQSDWHQGLAARERELKSLKNKLGKNKTRALDLCSGLKKKYSALIDAYMAYGVQTIVDLMGPDYIIEQAIKTLGKPDFLKKLEKEGYKFEEEGPPEAEQILNFVTQKLEEQMAIRTEAMLMSRTYIANDLGIAIITAKNLAGDLALVKTMTEELFKAYLAAERDFPVKPAKGIIWEQKWLDGYEQIQDAMPNRYKPANGLPGLFVGYPRIDEKIAATLKAMRALRDELLLELYERHEIPEADRETFGEDADDSPAEPGIPGLPGAGDGGGEGEIIKNPLVELRKNYAELVVILKLEREKYVVPLLEVYDDFAKIRAELGKPKKPNPKILSDFYAAKNKADKISGIRLARYTLPKGTSKSINNQFNKLSLLITISMAGKREEIEVTGAAPKPEEESESEEGDGGEGEGGEEGEGEEEPPPSKLVGKAEKFYDALLGAYDRFVDALVENLQNSLLSEPLPAKPVLRTFEEIEEDDRKEAEEREESGGGE